MGARPSDAALAPARAVLRDRERPQEARPGGSFCLGHLPPPRLGPLRMDGPGRPRPVHSQLARRPRIAADRDQAHLRLLPASRPAREDFEREPRDLELLPRPRAVRARNGRSRPPRRRLAVPDRGSFRSRLRVPVSGRSDGSGVVRLGRTRSAPADGGSDHGWYRSGQRNLGGRVRGSVGVRGLELPAVELRSGEPARGPRRGALWRPASLGIPHLATAKSLGTGGEPRRARHRRGLAASPAPRIHLVRRAHAPGAVADRS